MAFWCVFKHDGSLVNDVEKLNCNVDSNALGKPKVFPETLLKWTTYTFFGETGEQQ